MKQSKTYRLGLRTFTPKFWIGDIVCYENVIYTNGEYEAICCLTQVEIVQFNDEDRCFVYKMCGLEEWRTEQGLILVERSKSIGIQTMPVKED